MPRATPTAPFSRYAVYRNGVLLGMPAQHRLPGPQPGAGDAVPLHGRRDRRRRSPLARQRAGHDDAGAAARHRARLRLHARHDRRELRGHAAPLPADRRDLADLLPPRPRPRDRRPGRPARDGLGAPARHDVEPRVETQDPAILHTLLASAANRSDLVERISALVAENGYDGINIDFEAGAAADRPLLTAFVSRARADAARAGREADDGRRRQDRARRLTGRAGLLRLSRARRRSATACS